jgi:hypothetical protein
MTAGNIDHIDRRLQGPEADDRDNLAVACKLCNFIKGKYIPKGDTRAERLDDARRYVLAGRAKKQARLDAILLVVRGQQLAACN